MCGTLSRAHSHKLTWRTHQAVGRPATATAPDPGELLAPAPATSTARSAASVRRCWLCSGRSLGPFTNGESSLSVRPRGPSSTGTSVPQVDPANYSLFFHLILLFLLLFSFSLSLFWPLSSCRMACFYSSFSSLLLVQVARRISWSLA